MVIDGLVFEGILTGMVDTLGYESWESSPKEPLIKSLASVFR
jgi:hypothetical protein